MKAINISIPISRSYKNQHINIEDKKYTLDVEFLDGAHTVTTKPVEIGTLTHFNNMTIMGNISFNYNYNEKNKVLIIYGTEYTAEKAICLTTHLKNTKEFCYQQVNECKVRKKDAMFNRIWNYKTHLTPNLESMFVEVIKAANNQLIEAIKKIKGITLLIKTPPPVFTEEEYKNYNLVYQNGAFLEFYDPKKIYDESHSILGIQSIWGGTVHFNHGENFANVIGSTNDPHIAGKTWIELWRNQFGTPNICTSYQYQGFNCNNILYGGHIISGQQAQKVAPGSNYVYIMPICNAHNNNDNVYMAALQYLDGIWLNNYMH